MSFYVNNASFLPELYEIHGKELNFDPIYSRRRIGRWRKNQVFWEYLFFNPIQDKPS